MHAMQLQGKVAAEVEALVVLVEEWRVGCQWCRACGKEASGHKLEQCQGEDVGETQKEYEKYKEHWRVAQPMSRLLDTYILLSCTRSTL